MKIRTDFVTNSSSSSYVCCICGNDCSGYDIDLRDYDMSECINGHIFCNDHIKTDGITLEQAKKIVEEHNLSDIYLDDFTNAPDLIDAIIEAYGGYEIPSEICPICSFQDVDSSQLNEYKNVLLGKTNNELKKEILSKFKDHEDFEKFISLK